MNNNLNRINGAPFQSYIGDNFPQYSETSYGQFIIIDNTGTENINGLVPNTYNIFVDHIHIASGYGFSSAEELTNQITKINELEKNIDTLLEINNTTGNIINNLFNFKLSYSDGANHFSTYNSYGFETSFTDFSITYTTNDENSRTYNLNINKHELNYINPIEIEYVKEDTDISTEIPITRVYKDDKFLINIKLTSKYSQNNSNIFNTIDQLKNQISVNINGDNIISKDYLNNSDSDNNNYKLYSIDFDNILYEKDLIVEYIFNDGINKTILNTYTIPNLLQWGEIVINYPTDIFIDNLTIGICENVEEVNEKIGRNLFINYKNQNNLLIPNKLIDIPFNAGENFLHDYIITSATNNIEFYYNGIKSNNWVSKSYGNYNIWQSPQKYSGEHIWQIKITTNNG